MVKIEVVNQCDQWIQLNKPASQKKISFSVINANRMNTIAYRLYCCYNISLWIIRDACSISIMLKEIPFIY